MLWKVKQLFSKSFSDFYFLLRNGRRYEAIFVSQLWLWGTIHVYEKIFNADEVTWKKYSKSLFKSAKKLLQYVVLGPDERDVNECFLS